ASQQAAASQAAATGAPPKTPMAPQQAAPPAPMPQSQPASRTSMLDPFREVRTPTRNFGPARLASGAVTTPLARRLAGEDGIDLSRITGSGPHGRIVAGDVRAAASVAPAAAPMAARRAGAGADQIKALYRDTPYDEVPLDNMRRTIAARLTEAVQTIPHFHLT